MKFTGERVIPGEQDPDLFNEHRARYLFAQRFCAGKKVLDAACGSGYGSALLAETARSVIGVDIAAETVEYSRSQYGSASVQFAQADCLALPFSSGQFEVITAFEIVEHLPDAAVFLHESRRVLAPAGVLVLSTPNRLYYTGDRGEVNPFHQREFSFAEFRDLLREHFDHRQILFQNHVAGVLVAPADDVQTPAISSGSVIAELGPSSCTLEQAARTAYFLVALCSQQPLAAAEPLLYLPSAGNVLRERETHIHSLQAEVARLEKTLAEKGKYLLDLQEDYERKVHWAMDLDRRLGELQADYESKVRWAQDLDQQIERARGALQKLQQEFEERTAWALRLDRDLQYLLDSRWYRLGQKLRINPVPPSHRNASESGKS